MLGSSRKKSTKERVLSRQSYDALIKNYHPPTTKGALARHSFCMSPLPPSSPFFLPVLPILDSSSFVAQTHIHARPSPSSFLSLSLSLFFLFFLSFFLARRHFVFLFISPGSPRKLNKPRPSSLRPRKLGRRIKSYSLRRTERERERENERAREREKESFGSGSGYGNEKRAIAFANTFGMRDI